MRRELQRASLDRALEWLIPEGGELERRAVRVAQFAHALQQSGAFGEVDLQQASEELAALQLDLVESVLEDLLSLHLSAHVGSLGFASFGEPRRTAQAAWSELERLRSSRDGLPKLPGPGEPALDVAARLAAGLERCGLAPARLELWRARLAYAARGARAGADAFRQALLDLEPGRATPELHAALLVGLVESTLDRGAVREARELLGAHATLVDADRRLARLRVWACLAAGELETAREHARGLAPWPGTLPGALADLRERWREAAPLLAGAPGGAGRGVPSVEPPRSRPHLKVVK